MWGLCSPLRLLSQRPASGACAGTGGPFGLQLTTAADPFHTCPCPLAHRWTPSSWAQASQRIGCLTASLWWVALMFLFNFMLTPGFPVACLCSCCDHPSAAQSQLSCVLCCRAQCYRAQPARQLAALALSTWLAELSLRTPCTPCPTQTGTNILCVNLSSLTNTSLVVCLMTSEHCRQ